MRARLSVVLLAVGVVLFAACGSDDVGEVTSVGADGATDGAGSTTDGDGDGETDDGEGSSTTVDDQDTDDDSDDGDGSGTTETSAGGEAALAGDPFDIGPSEGDRLDVVGVAHDDELNFRELPDPGSPIVTAVAPQATSPAVISQGEGRLLSRSAWWSVTVGGEEAWANFSFLGMLGGTTDVFDEVSDQLGPGDEDSLDDLVDAIVAVRGSDGPEPRVTYVTDPDVGSGDQEVVVDIIGYGDDALKGERFLLTVDVSAAGVGLVGAEATIICARGVSGTACV